MVASCLDPDIRRWRHRPAATSAEADAYIRSRARDWARETRLSWAVCDPDSDRMLGEVEVAALDLPMGTGDAACWALPVARSRGMITTALSAVLRFAFDELGLQRITYAWADGNLASERVAQKCGFVVEGRMRSAWVADGERRDVIVSGRLATDR